MADRSSYISQWYSGSGHHAIDVAADCGRRILASKAGKVIFSGWRSNGGAWQVWIRTPRSGKDLYTLYAHMLGRPPVQSGQWVQAEQTIGIVGSTGLSSGCHLHIEMWRGYFWREGSYPVYPWPRIDHGRWLPDRYR